MDTKLLKEIGISRRRDDMSETGFLQVMVDNEGDYGIMVSDGKRCTQVEFVVHCCRSPKVIEALALLKTAIDEDNIFNPLVT